jgi:ABC transporter substrate binding protein (PQQ-dependent alcohol dehydrogenase system)
MQFSSMTGRLGVFIVLFLWCCAGNAGNSAELRELAIAYIDRQDDPFYSGSRGYAGLYTVEHKSPLPAAELAVAEASTVGSAIGVEFKLLHHRLAANEDPGAAIRRLRADSGIAAAIVDLPLEDMVQASTAAAIEPIVLLNARHTDIALRQATCRTHLFHTMPSLDMLTDALAQGLRARNWTRILLLEGEKPQDVGLSKAFQGSALKFGLKISEVRRFVLGNDPRQRDQNNVRLLTGGVRHDVVFVADASREFAVFVPYNTMDPRPVVGSEGLIPMAWHIYWERHGAPQLNRRFAKRNGRPMSEADWATWVAVRAIVEAVVRNRGMPARPLTEALLDPNLTLELYKGFPGSFRPWNRQLRQPILLATSNAVIALAPVEGVLHKDNILDTLGVDAPEFRCQS